MIATKKKRPKSRLPKFEPSPAFQHNVYVVASLTYEPGDESPLMRFVMATLDAAAADELVAGINEAAGHKAAIGYAIDMEVIDNCRQFCKQV